MAPISVGKMLEDATIAHTRQHKGLVSNWMLNNLACAKEDNYITIVWVCERVWVCDSVWVCDTLWVCDTVWLWDTVWLCDTV